MQKSQNLLGRIFAALLAVCFGMAWDAQAQLALDSSAGTNIVDSLGDNFTYGGSVLLPIVLAVLLISGMIGLYKRLSRKAGVST